MGKRSSLLLLLAVCGGCPRAESPEPSPPPEPQGQWRVLTGPRASRVWATLQGRASFLQDTVLVNPDAEGIATVATRWVRLRDGAVEIRVRRAGGDANAPYTIALRCKASWDWQSLYFVHRPGRLEVCRGRSDLPFPAPLAVAAIPAGDGGDGTDCWRFDLVGEQIVCRLAGREVCRLRDESPCRGAIAVTADRCRLEVLEVRCADGEPPEGSAR